MFIEIDDSLIFAWSLTVLAGVLAIRLYERWKAAEEWRVHGR